MQQQLLRLDPDKVLHFTVDEALSATTKLVAENITNGFVAFKVKTTAPKSYLVRPSSGVIAAKESQEIQIILQPVSNMTSGVSQDRFLVQSCVVTSNVPLSREEWIDMDKAKVADQRLSVTVDVDQARARTFNPAQAATAQIPTDYGELKGRYEELLSFCVATEKQKRELELEVESLRRKGASGLAGAGLQSVKHGFALWQVTLIVLGALILGKLVRII